MTYITNPKSKVQFNTFRFYRILRKKEPRLKYTQTQLSLKRELLRYWNSQVLNSPTVNVYVGEMRESLLFGGRGVLVALNPWVTLAHEFTSSRTYIQSYVWCFWKLSRLCFQRNYVPTYQEKLTRALIQMIPQWMLYILMLIMLA